VADGAVSEHEGRRTAAGPVVVADRIRWSDVDPLGIIRYDTYVRLLEIGETELFRAAGLPYAVIREQMGVWLPRRRLEFEYHAPARLDDLVEVRSFFSHVGTTSLTLAFDFADAATGALRASAELVVVCVERDTLAKFPLPAAVRAAIAPFVMTGAAVRALTPPR
jgi:acyl-CoA thioester hydrolase